jgi:hypothetical protein
VRTFRWPARAALLAPLLLVPLSVSGAAADEPPPTGPAPTVPVESGTAPAPPTPPVESGPPSTEPAQPAATVPVAAYLPAEPGLANPHPVPIDGVVATADPATVLVTFWAGPEACVGVQRVVSFETADEVTLTVFLGERAPGEPCTLIARHVATAVTLDAPLGERAVVDGAARPTVPADYAHAAFAAWAAGDHPALHDLANGPALDVLAARPPATDDDWGAATCEGAAGSTICSWSGAGAVLALRVDNAAAAAGAPDAVVEARFSPRQGGVGLWPLATAEEAANTQAEVDAGSSPWMVDPATVAEFYANAELTWPDVDVVPAETGSFVVTDRASGATVHVTLTQPARQGPGGIWVVTQLASA